MSSLAQKKSHARFRKSKKARWRYWSLRYYYKNRDRINAKRREAYRQMCRNRHPQK